MEDENSILPPPKRMPWNKGKLIGAKPPLLARHVWSIRTKLQIERRARELAMFNLAIDSKLRGCDVVAMKLGLRRIDDCGNVGRQSSSITSALRRRVGVQPSGGLDLIEIGDQVTDLIERTAILMDMMLTSPISRHDAP